MANIEKFNGGYNDLSTGIRYYDDGSQEALGAGGQYMAQLRMGQTQATGNPNANKGTIQDDGYTYPAYNGGLGGTFSTSPTPAGPGGTALGGSPVSGGSGSTVVGGTPVSGGGGLGLSGGSKPSPGIDFDSFMKNPYLEQLKKQTSDQMTDSWNRSVLPGIQQSAVASGGFGGSRQGVIEANAMNDLGKNLSSAMAGLDSAAFNQALQYDLGLRNNQLGNKNADNSYDLGLRNNQLGYYNAQNNYDLGLRGNQLGYGQLGYQYAGLDRQINNDNIANQMMGTQLGMNIYDRLLGNNQAALNAGNNIQNTPLNYWNQISNGVNGIANGYGSSSGNTSNNGNQLLGMLGGAQLGGQVGNWWGGGGGQSTATGGNRDFMNGLAGMGVF